MRREDERRGLRREDERRGVEVQRLEEKQGRNNRETAEYRSSGKHGNTEEMVISEENYHTGRESKLCGFGSFK